MTGGIRAAMPGVGSFERLFEGDDLPRFDLPEAIEAIYGPFGLPERVVFGNFVASVDGVVDIPGETRSSSSISRGDVGDRFVMALLRASADAVLIGHGTFRAHPGPWSAQRAFPDGADVFAQMRSDLGLAAQPKLVVVSGSGELAGPDRKLDDAVVITTSAGRRAATAAAGARAEVVAVGTGDRVDPSEMLALLLDRGYRRILSEGGPHLMGQLMHAGLVDELFLSISPLIAGGGGRRATLAAGVEILPGAVQPLRLLSARRAGSYLFLRYRLEARRSAHAGGAAPGE